MQTRLIRLAIEFAMCVVLMYTIYFGSMAAKSLSAGKTDVGLFLFFLAALGAASLALLVPAYNVIRRRDREERYQKVKLWLDEHEISGPDPIMTYDEYPSLIGPELWEKRKNNDKIWPEGYDANWIQRYGPYHVDDEY